ncbi:MAG: OprD family outer membrane porin [Sphingomonadales bacterium]
MALLRKIFFIGFLIWAKYGASQLLPYQHFTERDRDKTDTTSLQHFFRHGEFYGHARYYFMATDNEAGLTDYFANAFGMGIGYETGKFKGFQIGLSGFFIYNIGSSNLSKPDALTGVKNRYEVGQFDMLDPANKHDMDRLEDLYIKYSYKKSQIKFGKQHIKTPFINPQDGRMRPTLVEGVMFESSDIKNTRLEGGWLYGVSPRSTVKWFGIGESMGVFPAGLNSDGSKSQYAGNVQSKAVYFLGIHYKLKEGVKLQLWDFHIDNVLNSGLIQLNAESKINNQVKLIAGAQCIVQKSVGNGGNSDSVKTYVLPGSEAMTYGFRLGIHTHNDWLVHFNYNHITNNGRYLMPREWGRDPFFTFMPRERNEGLSNVHAATATVSKGIKKGFKSELGLGYFSLPEVNDAYRNKYGMPSYWQFNADIRYLFSGFLKGLEAQLLFVYKGNADKKELQKNYIINKTNMSLYNLVVNYHF